MKPRSSLKNPLIILASGSASRRQQLKDLNFNFKVEVSGVDEDIYKPGLVSHSIGSKACSGKDIALNNSTGEGESASFLAQGRVAQQIAQAKVEKVALKYPKALVLGGDQMACLGQQIFNKPLTNKQALLSLKQLQGKTHILWTALYIRYGKKSFSYLEKNKMTMRALTEDQIKAYIKYAKPLKCAGAYALERYGIGLFKKIETQDQSAIIGFPLITLINQLVHWGVFIPFLNRQKQVKLSTK